MKKLLTTALFMAAAYTAPAQGKPRTVMRLFREAMPEMGIIRWSNPARATDTLTYRVTPYGDAPWTALRVRGVDTNHDLILEENEIDKIELTVTEKDVENNRTIIEEMSAKKDPSGGWNTRHSMVLIKYQGDPTKIAPKYQRIEPVTIFSDNAAGLRGVFENLRAFTPFCTGELLSSEELQNQDQKKTTADYRVYSL